MSDERELGALGEAVKNLVSAVERFDAHMSENERQHAAFWKKLEEKAAAEDLARAADKIAYHDKMLYLVFAVPIVAGGVWGFMEWVKNVGGRTP